MFSSHSFIEEIRPDMHLTFKAPHIEHEEEISKVFENAMVDHHHPFAEISMPQISLNDARSLSPDFRIHSFDPIFDHP